MISSIDDKDDPTFAARLANLGVERVRVLGDVSLEPRESADRAGVYLADRPVTSNGRVELLSYAMEQSVRRTLHRFGNLVGVDARRTTAG